MQRVKLFLKGNLDVYDSLHSCRINDSLCWNGVNQVQSIRDAHLRVQLQHETFTRSDALLASSGHAPSGLLERHLPLTSFPAESQFSLNVFSVTADAYIFSIQADISVSLVRHKSEGYLFNPESLPLWKNQADIDWLKSNFTSVKALTAQESMENFRMIVDRLREKNSAPILIFNACPIIPGANVHCYSGLTDDLSTRIQKFNLELIELSRKTGISIVDVNRILSSHGVNHLKLDPWHLNSTGLKLVAEEVSRILLETL